MIAGPIRVRGARTALAGFAVAGLAVAGLVAGCAAPSSATGVVVSVDSSGLEEVRAFRLRTDDGAVLDLAIDGPLENAAEFPLGHLGEHVASAEPVRVAYRRDGDRLVATRVEDAP